MGVVRKMKSYWRALILTFLMATAVGFLSVSGAPAEAVAATTTLNFTISGYTLTPTSLQPGQLLTAAATFGASNNASRYNVGFQVQTAAGGYVSDIAWFKVNFKAGTAITETASWTVPKNLAAGSYSVKAFVFNAQWNLQAVQATAFTVGNTASACGSTPSGSTTTQTTITTGSITATAAQFAIAFA